jgi:hypothetical protein
MNPNAIPILKENRENINWAVLSGNPNAIELLRENPEKIDWRVLSGNPNAIPILKEKGEKIDWDWLSTNEAIIEVNYEGLQERCEVYKEELMGMALHPCRIEKLLDQGICIEELECYI